MPYHFGVPVVCWGLFGSPWGHPVSSSVIQSVQELIAVGSAPPLAGAWACCGALRIVAAAGPISAAAGRGFAYPRGFFMTVSRLPNPN